MSDGELHGEGRLSVTLRNVSASLSGSTVSLRQMLASYGAAELITDETSAALWSAVRDVEPFAASGPRALWPVWRIVCPPASGGAFGEALQRESGGEVIYDWGGGLIWAALPPAADAHAKALRQRVDKIGGHATLIRASDEVRSAVDVFPPQPAGLAALGQRVKHSFDPRNVLNRGRLSRGPAV